MKDKIKKYLAEIEEEKQVKILWACETGSRAWGFPSTDSDYDIRLIYVHKKDWYLSLTNQKDSIERMLDNKEIDIAGWDLKKSLTLLKKSNASFLERIQSPIIYQADDAFISELLEISSSFYSKIATMHHYLSMAKKFIEELEAKEEFKLKKFFYTLRSAMVCKWIIEKEKMPPIAFEKIYKNLSLDENLIRRIEELIAMKSKVDEAYFHKGEEELITFIKSCIKQSEAGKNSLPSAKGAVQALNELFRKYISKYDH